MKNISYVIEGTDIKKSFKGFTLDLEKLLIPEGFATALIGENGAGKTTLLNILSGVRLDYQGDIRYFGKYSDSDREAIADVKSKIGYTGGDDYYIPGWSVSQVIGISKLLFDDFDTEKFYEWCRKLDITSDEPASPLDPLMRDTLCEILRDYLANGNGKRSIFFSTHNISDMEQVTDYAIIMEKGRIVEQGFVTDLKEKYIVVKGEKEHSSKARNILYTIQENTYGFEGICLAERLDELAGMGVETEIPSLSQITVAVMKQYSKIHLQ